MKISLNIFGSADRDKRIEREIFTWVLFLVLMILACSISWTHRSESERALKKEQQLNHWILDQPTLKSADNTSRPQLTSIAMEKANMQNIQIAKLLPKGDDELVCVLTGIPLKSLLLWLNDMNNKDNKLNFTKVMLNQDPNSMAGSVNATVYITR